MSYFPLSSWSEDSKNIWLSSSPIWPYITHSPPGLTTRTKSSKSYDISSTDIYIGEDIEFSIHVFYWCIPLDHEIYTNCKKAYNLIKVLFSYNLFSGIKSQRAKKIKKKTLATQYHKLLTFLRLPQFHFIKSLSAIELHLFL